jgi:hypothetical protein
MVLIQDIQDIVNPYPICLDVHIHPQGNSSNAFINFSSKHITHFTELNDILADTAPKYKNQWQTQFALYISPKDKAVLEAVERFIEYFGKVFTYVKMPIETHKLFLNSPQEIKFIIHELALLLEDGNFNTYHRKKVISQIA